ncbi:MAG: response regulator [Anaerolineae bacterium]|jgi:DNA-binding response OmpR family regulator|nr:response regulator [Anaerolineae bacterium]
MPYQILMIDDDREMVTLGKLILEREGFEVLYAYSGAEGLEILNQDDNSIALVLLDIMMVGMDGWQVLEAIRNSEQHVDLPVIMLTARHYLEDESETSTYSDLFDGYVVKPFVVRDLLGKINELLNAKTTQTS